MKYNIYLYIYSFVCLFDWSQLKESIRIKKKRDESDEEYDDDDDDDDDEDDDDAEENYDEDEEDNEQVSSKDGTHGTHASKIPSYMDRWSPSLFTRENNMLMAVFRALAFYQCELGSALYLTPFVGWVCWFSSLPGEFTGTTVFPRVLRGFFPLVLRFSPLTLIVAEVASSFATLSCVWFVLKSFPSK